MHLGVAVGYWLFDERPATMKLQAAVPELRRVVAVIPSTEAQRVADERAAGLSMAVGAMAAGSSRSSIWDSGPATAESAPDHLPAERESPPAGFPMRCR